MSLVTCVGSCLFIDHYIIRKFQLQYINKKYKMSSINVDDDDEEDEKEATPSITIVKTKLNTLCMDAYRNALCDRINGMVLQLNQVVAEAYLFANFHVTRLLDDPVFDVAKLPKLDRNFYYRCLVAVGDSRVRCGTLGKEIEQSQSAFDNLRPAGSSKIDIKPWGQAIADLSVQMATMACNSVWANIGRIVKKYLSLNHSSLKKHHNLIVKLVVDYPKSDLEDKKSIPENVRDVTKESIKNVVRHLRSLLPLPTGRQYNSRSHLAMRLFHSILSELISASSSDKKKLPRLFNLLPRKNGFTINNIPVSSMTLMKLLGMKWGDSAPLEIIKGDGRSEDHDRLWRKYFNVRGVETQAVRFGRRILTDGKAVSIQMNRYANDRHADADAEGFPLDADADECNEAVCKGAVRAGVDPGMTDIITVATDEGNTRSFSSAKFSEMAGYNTSKRRTSRWNTEHEQLISEIPSSHTTDTEALKNHIRCYMVALPVLLQHRFDRGYRSMRFLRYVGKQKTIEKVCDTIAPRDRVTVVGFGNWSNQGHGIRRSCSGPIKEIRKRLSCRENVLFKNVDEYKTSCTCHGCFNSLVNMRATSTLWKMRKVVENGVETYRRLKEVVNNNKVHKVLHCRNSVPCATSRCGATWNRDVNAAKNLLLLLDIWMDGRERPAAFCRRSSKNTVSYEASKSSNHGHPPVDGHEDSMLSVGPARMLRYSNQRSFLGPPS